MKTLVMFEWVIVFPNECDVLNRLPEHDGCKTTYVDNRYVLKDAFSTRFQARAYKKKWGLGRKFSVRLSKTYVQMNK